jgi:cytochrome c peroxidase
MSRILWILAALLVLSGCVGPIDSSAEEDGEQVASVSEELSGPDLYLKETFCGNGRTCATCHPLGTGTFSPAEAKLRFEKNPKDPLFRAIDSDDGKGKSYHRLIKHATVFVDIPLPSNVKLADQKKAKSVKLERGVPSTLDTPALDPVLMYDGREPSLEDQAESAILGHAEADREPTAKELSKISDFEETLFSSETLKKYANGGPAPKLPAGKTDAEKRGATWFDSSVPSGICAHCHSGPMLNEANQFNVFGFPVGTRFITAFVSELNPRKLPTKTFFFTEDNKVTKVTTPDPGRALITGKLSDVNFFKIPTLWNAKNTAPYFHDNSSKTLEAMVHHYKNFFEVFTDGGLVLSPQDEADIVAYMKLL